MLFVISNQFMLILIFCAVRIQIIQLMFLLSSHLVIQLAKNVFVSIAVSSYFCYLLFTMNRIKSTLDIDR